MARNRGPADGTALARSIGMGFRTLAEIRAYRAARAMKLEVYRLVKAHASAYRDYRFRSQIFEAAASVEMNIAEGFRRYSAGEFAHFLRIARASLEEAAGRIQDGIDRGYFAVEDCQVAFGLCDETGRLTTALITSLKPFTSSRKPVGPPRQKR